MARYIIRLDDACPTMNHENWERMEYLLDSYGVKPIVGVIPDNCDPDFAWDASKDFWKTVSCWQAKGWSISVHGLQHALHKTTDIQAYFQKSHGIKTEFAGVPLERQREMLCSACEIFRKEGIVPDSFFAPAHTYDKNTVTAVGEHPELKFISDGYALRPYKKEGMVFMPSICDGPFNLPLGIYTFVFHPSVMREASFARLDAFLRKNSTKITTTKEALESVQDCQGLVGWILENGIYWIRGARKLVKKR